MLGDSNVHANFSVDDLEAAKGFYVDKLGFGVVKEFPTQKMMVLEAGGGTMVNIYEKDDHKAWDSTVLGIMVDDVRKVASDLTNIGVTFEKLPMTDDDGIASDPEIGDAAWFRDPAGNWVCVSNTAAKTI